MEKCPACGAKQVERVNRSTGEYFWGCSKWPKCKKTTPFDNSSWGHQSYNPTPDNDDIDFLSSTDKLQLWAEAHLMGKDWW